VHAHGPRHHRRQDGDTYQYLVSRHLLPPRSSPAAHRPPHPAASRPACRP
jgi:hypothetical protein